MTLKELKPHVGKWRLIIWGDVQSKYRTTLEDMKKLGLQECSCGGRIIHLERHLCIVENENADDESDYTNLHPALITDIRKLK